MENGLISEFNALNIDEFENLSKKNKIIIQDEIIYYKDRYTVDISISRSFWNLNKIDDRILYTNSRIFEDETYQRLRYEISKYLIKDKNKNKNKGKNKEKEKDKGKEDIY